MRHAIHVSYSHNLDESAETELLSAARAGDSRAFELLVLPRRGMLYSIARRILRNDEDAEDAVQTCFLNALVQLRTFEGKSRFSSWLTQIVVNQALMTLRAARRKRETPLDAQRDDQAACLEIPVADPRPTPEEHCVAEQHRAVLESAIGSLRPRHKEVIHLRLEKELSVEEIATVLGLSLAAAKSRLHQARVNLSAAAEKTLSANLQRRCA
jgi:RNA polymerase sigma-70 factor (ECF subfamily)